LAQIRASNPLPKTHVLLKKKREKSNYKMGETGPKPQREKRKLTKAKIWEITTIPQKVPQKAVWKSIPPREISTIVTQGC